MIFAVYDVWLLTQWINCSFYHLFPVSGLLLQHLYLAPDLRYYEFCSVYMITCDFQFRQ